MRNALIVLIAAAALSASAASAQTTRGVQGPAAVAPLTEQQPPAKIVVDQHRLLTGGVGHNPPQEVPQAFAQAVIDVDAF